MQNKKVFIFIVEMPPVLFKDSAKIRLSETNGNLFLFVSVRILFKSNTMQNKSVFIFIVEMPPVLFKSNTMQNKSVFIFYSSSVLFRGSSYTC